MPRCLWQAAFLCLKSAQYFFDWLAAWCEEASWRIWHRAFPRSQPCSFVLSA